MSNDSYTVFIKGKKVYSNLNVYEYMDIMENLSLEFYQTGSPRPSDIETKIFNELKGLIDAKAKTGLVKRQLGTGTAEENSSRRREWDEIRSVVS